MSQVPASGRRVLLVHGLWNAKLWLTPLAWRLRHAGFRVDGFGYPSIVGGAEAAVEALIEHLHQETDLDRYIERAIRIDPDIWVVEVEDKDGRHFLTEPVEEG